MTRSCCVVRSGWDHRAFWGADPIPWGASGTPPEPPRPLPFAGEWVRLEVCLRPRAWPTPPSAAWPSLPLGGRAVWDWAVWSAPPPSGQPEVSVTPTGGGGRRPSAGPHGGVPGNRQAVVSWGPDRQRRHRSNEPGLQHGFEPGWSCSMLSVPVVLDLIGPASSASGSNQMSAWSRWGGELTSSAAVVYSSKRAAGHVCPRDRQGLLKQGRADETRAAAFPPAL